MRRLYNNIRFHSNWVGYVLYKITGKIKDGFIFKTRSGMHISVPSRLMHTYKECFLDQTYFKGFATDPIQTDTPYIIDIGANVGYFSLNFFCVYPKARIIAFEPIPNNFQLLKSYKEKYTSLDLTIVNEAVSGKEGELELFFDRGDSFSTSATLFNHTAEPDMIKVKTTTLHNIINHWNIPTLDLLKLDCEGAEYEILYGAPQNILEKIRAITIETHVGEKKEENIVSLNRFLQENGYQTNILGSKIWASRSA